MAVNFKAQTDFPKSYTKTNNTPIQYPHKVDGSSSYLEIKDYHPLKKIPKKKPSNEFATNLIILSTTIPILLAGGYVSAIRTAEKKFFVDSAEKSKKYFKPIISELRDKIDKVNIKTEDKLTLKCWDINPQNAEKYVIVCHGIGQNLNDCQELYHSLHQKGFGVFALEYRGYADNPGTVQEHGLYKDADAALKYLKNKGIKEEKIGIVGYSLGGAIATDLSSRNHLAFTILTNTFNNAKELSKNGVNYMNLNISDKTKKFIDKFPEKLIPTKNSYRSDLKIDKIKNPIIFIHTQNDKDIPISLAQKLHQKAKNASSLKFITLNSGDHYLDEIKIKAISDAVENFLL